MPFDYKKEYKEFYLPPKTPGLVTVPAMNFLAVRGQGDPNQEGGAYKEALGLLYAVAFTIKMSKLGRHKLEGYFDYVVPPLEGLWWQEGVRGVDYARKADFRWISLIRLPEFVTEEVFRWAVREATEKKRQDFSRGAIRKRCREKGDFAVSRRQSALTTTKGACGAFPCATIKIAHFLVRGSSAPRPRKPWWLAGPLCVFYAPKSYGRTAVFLCHPGFSRVEFLSWEEGLCVQCMHLGPYDDEPATVAAMDAYARGNGCVPDFGPGRFHHEIYLSDVRRCRPEKLKTVIRQPVRKEGRP